MIYLLDSWMYIIWIKKSNYVHPKIELWVSKSQIMDIKKCVRFLDTHNSVYIDIII